MSDDIQMTSIRINIWPTVEKIRVAKIEGGKLYTRFFTDHQLEEAFKDLYDDSTDESKVMMRLKHGEVVKALIEGEQ